MERSGNGVHGRVILPLRHFHDDRVLGIPRVVDHSHNDRIYLQNAPAHHHTARQKMKDASYAAQTQKLESEGISRGTDDVPGKCSLLPGCLRHRPGSLHRFRICDEVRLLHHHAVADALVPA